MRNLVIRLWILVAFIGIVAVPVHAQGGNQGVVEGFVTDASGAVVAGASVVITDTAKGTQFTDSTDRAGRFVFAVVPSGTYSLKVQQQGFATSETANVIVTVGAKISLPVVLGVGASTQHVEVNADVPVVDTVRTTVAESVNARAVSELPVNGRNFLDFTLLTPGVVRDVRGGDLSFGGQRGTLNSLTIDGTDNNNTFFGQSLGRSGSGRAPYQFSQDAVQEFQVNTSSYAPEFGRAGGAVINVVTKSGTNQFHGTAFEFFRDRGLNANDEIYSQQLAFFRSGLRSTAPFKPAYHFNQFGGNVGGPIWKDKLFFFFDYDGQRNNVGIPVSLSLPAPIDAATTAANAYLLARSQTYLTGFNQNVYLGKVDWTVNQRNHISVRYNGQRFQGTNLENSGTTSAAEHTGSSNVNTDTYAAEWNSTFNSNLTNTLRLSYQKDDEPGLSNSQNPEAAVRSAGATLLTVGRNNFSPRQTKATRQQYADYVTFVLGGHTLKVGGDVLKDTILNFFPGNFSGAFVFDSTENFGRSLLGQPLLASANGSSSLQLTEAYAGAGTSGPTTHPDNLQLAGFAQDDWRASRRLDLTFGVRWDRQSFHQPGVSNPLALATGFNTAVAPVDDLNFGPRVGFAYQPYNDSRTVIRGGGGIFFGNTPSILLGTASSNNGINLQTFTFQPTAANPSFPLHTSYPNNTCGAPQQTPSCAPPTGFNAVKSNIYAFSSKYHQPEVIQYNLQVQQQVAKDASFTLGYLGVRGLRLTRTRDNNFTTETPASIAVQGSSTPLSYQLIGGTPTFLNPNFNRVFLFEASAHSTYHGLTAQLDQRFASGLQFSVAYTFSKVIDDAPDATAVVLGSDDAKLNYDPLRPRLDLAPGNDDVRNRFVASTVWDLDTYARGFHGIVRQVAGGWQISAIGTAQSGQPYSSTLNSALNGSQNTASQRVPGTSRNQNRLPNFYSLDPRLTKTIGAGDRINLKLIAEAFNILNHSNVTGVFSNQFIVGNIAGTPTLIPNNSPTSTTRFQLPRVFSNSSGGASYAGRVIQLAAKVTF
ncbi:MAG: carboxypeptidase regulatory-like domain-containing protein [Acidobacteriaceae bacterium]